MRKYQGKTVTAIRDAVASDPYFRKLDPGMGDQVIITLADGSEQVVPRHHVVEEPDALVPAPAPSAPVENRNFQVNNDDAMRRQEGQNFANAAPANQARLVSASANNPQFDSDADQRRQRDDAERNRPAFEGSGRPPSHE